MGSYHRLIVVQYSCLMGVFQAVIARDGDGVQVVALDQARRLLSGPDLDLLNSELEDLRQRLVLLVGGV